MQDGDHQHGPRENFVPLLLIVAAVVAAALFTRTFNTVAVLASIVAMVMIHEFGHFLTAKWSGMKVTEYFLGFGPRLWSFKRGETEYGVKAIPAGGYVRISGMSSAEKVDAVDEPRTYRQQPYWQKVVVASAGSFMHFVMAFLILVILFGFLGVKPAAVIDEYPSEVTTSPARQGGLVAGDKIKSIDGIKTDDWVDVQRVVRERPNKTVEVVVERRGNQIPLSIALADRTAMPASERAVASQNGADLTTLGYLGARRANVYSTESLGESAVLSVKTMGTALQLAVNSLVDRFSPSGIESLARQVRDARSNGEARAAAQESNQPAPQTETSQDDARLVSPLGLVTFSHQAAEAGIRPVLQFLFSVNLFVGVFNLIPLLPFDGGHIAIATYEKLRSLRGRRHFVNHEKLMPLSYAVLFVLISLSLSALWLDAWYPVQDVFG